MKKQFLQLALIGVSLFTFISCEESTKENENPTHPIEEYKFVLGIEAVGGQDILVSSDDITSGEISPIGNGFEQPAWMSFYKAGNIVLSAGYTTANVITAYDLGGENGGLRSVDELSTDQALYAFTNIDEETFIGVGSPRDGFEERTIYTFDKQSMSIANRTLTRIDERRASDLVSFPTGVHRRGDKLYISYFLTGTGAIVPAFATPMADTAKIAVYDYPSMDFVKIIKDTRTSEIGRYTADLSLQEDENGNIYTYSTSSLACGFLPTPTKPSGFLRIKNGQTEFDQDYFLNFEAKSGGYKINSAIYVGNNKMLVRAVMVDATHWSTYAPNIEEGLEHLSFMLVDLNTEVVTPISGIPMTGGGWGLAHLVKDGKVYVNVSNSKGGAIYEIDVETASAKQGATVLGHYTKGIFELPVQN